MKPGQQAIIKDGEVNVREVDVEVYTTWMYENFRFKSESIQEIMTKLSRWYTIDVFYMNEAVKIIILPVTCLVMPRLLMCWNY